MFFKRSLVLSVASIAAMAVSAHAQDNAGGGNPPAAEATPSPDAGSSPPAREAAPGQMKDGNKSARDGASGNSSATDEGPDRAKQGKADKSDDKADNKKAEGDGSKSDDGHARVRNDDDKTKPEKGSAGRDTPSKAGNEAREDRGQDSSGKAGSAEGKGSKASISQISPEQKTKVKSVFTQHHAKAVTDIDVKVGIGVVVPRSVRFYPVPEEIIVIAPEYRDYLYFVVGNQVCVVDPETYEIVDIIQIA